LQIGRLRMHSLGADTWSETVKPASRRARIAVIAEVSLKSQSAVTGRRDAKSFFVAMQPACGEGESSTMAD
jgi:hypothetical protein